MLPPSPNQGFIALLHLQVRGLPPSYPHLLFVGDSFSLLRSASDESCRDMRTFNFTLLAVLGYVAMIGASTVEIPDEYVSL